MVIADISMPVDYSAIPYNQLPDPGVAYNEYPNPPWNTTRYDWGTEYPVCSPEWFAQHAARSALKLGLQYGTRDRAKEQKANLDRYLEAREGRETPQIEGDTPMQHAKEEKPLRIRIAVLADDSLYFCPDGKLIKRKVQTETPGDIFQAAMDASVHAVWVLSETALSQNARKEWCEIPSDHWAIKNVQYSRDNEEMATAVSAYKKKEARTEGETGRTITIMFPQWGSWNLDEVTEPRTLLGAVGYLEDTLGERIDCQPQTYGRRLMIAYNEDNATKGWIQPVNIHKEIPEVIRGLDCIWTLKLDAAALNSLREHNLDWVVVYDGNSKYPAACTGVKLGVGAPVHEKQPAFNVKNPLPGLYHCRISGNSPDGFDGVTLPHPTDGKMEGWFWTYTTQLLFDLGFTVEIDEAYVWYESHVIMRTWAERIWGSRCQLQSGNPLCKVERYKNQSARDAAYQSVKPVLNSSLGMLAHKKDLDALEAILSNPESTDNDRKYATLNLSWYRPDWYALIMDRARALMFRRIKKFQAAGAVLLGVQTDALFYAASTPDHQLAIPGMMDRENLLGGFKRKFKNVDFRLEEVANQLTGKRADIQLLNSFMKKRDEE